MLKLHLYNLQERKQPKQEEIEYLLNNGIHKNFHKPCYVVEILNNNKIFAYINFNETLDFYNQKLNQLNFPLELMQSIKDTFVFSKTKKFSNINMKEDTFGVYGDSNGIEYVFNFFSNEEFEESFYTFFSLNLPVIIKNKDDEELQFIDRDNRNVLLNLELQFLLKHINLPYGLAFNLLKYQYTYLDKFKDSNNIKVINNQYINIQNNHNNFFTEKNTIWHSNRSLNILNLTNVQTFEIENILFFKNSKNNNLYLKITDTYFKIKMLFPLNKKNLVKAFNKSNKSTEIFYIINAFRTLNNKFLIRVTKSSNSKLEESLEEISNDFLSKNPYINFLD